MIDLDRALELQRAGIGGFLRMLAGGSEGGRLLERDGVTAAVVPACPDRSVVNSVTYEKPGALAASLDELAAAYDEAGVRAWTVWIPQHEREAIGLVESAGHRFDGEPTAMTLELDQLAEPRLGDLDWDREAEPEEFGRVNDLAYGTPVGTFAAAIGRPPAELEIGLYRARAAGEAASVVGTLDVEDDCVVFFVATVAEHRGKGLAGRLLHAALAEARERGLRTSSLQATRLGLPVYERLGYRTACRLEMWERRGA